MNIIFKLELTEFVFCFMLLAKQQNFCKWDVDLIMKSDHKCYFFFCEFLNKLEARHIEYTIEDSIVWLEILNSMQ